MRPLAAVGVVLCILGWLGTACQAPPITPTSTPPTTITLTPVHTWTPTPAPGPLTDTQAVALVKEELAARGVATHTLRVTIAGEPRWASIRYSSLYAVDGRAFHPQTVLVALAAARAMARVHPPINGGMRLAVMPGGESNMGLKVIIIDGTCLKAWAKGSISDQEFVSGWTVGTITKE